MDSSVNIEGGNFDDGFSSLDAIWKHIPLLILSLVVAGCSISYELLIAHSLALLAANALVWYSLVIGCFLLGMGCGSLLCDRCIPICPSRAELVWCQLRNLEIVLSIVGFASVPILHSAHSLYCYLDYWGYTDLGLALFFGSSLGLSLLIGALSGIELPLLISAGKCSTSDDNLTNPVLAFDYFGSLLGAVCFPLVLLPSFSTFTIGTIVATVNLMAALILSAWFVTGHISRFVRFATVTLLLVFLFSFAGESQIEQFFLKRYYCYRLLSRSLGEYFSLGTEYPDILRIHSSYQQIDLLHDLEGDGTDPFVQGFSTKFTSNQDWPHNRLLFLNGDWQFHSNHEEVYHEWFAHVPIMQTARIPARVLVLGGGDGLLIRELLRYPEISSITHVDLDSRLIELAKAHPILLRMNNNALHDDRVETIIDDGFQYVRQGKETFDAIYIDFPTPTDYELSKLYSREFYTFVRRRLAPDGVMVFDSVSTGALFAPDESGLQKLRPDNHWQVFSHTLQAAGFTRIVPYSSTLGFDNSEALNMAEGKYSSDEAKARILSYVLQRQQGFILAGNPGTFFGGPFRQPPGAPLSVLNSERYKLSFQVQYPESSEIDFSFVNSIFRPRLIVMPIWNARLPF
ncbi:MAG: hypothetical protein KDD70_08370 [Bdellovibrionales bacterium]|nr:hypothetical protein [Bdellovibrionales bacterium]